MTNSTAKFNTQLLTVCRSFHHSLPSFLKKPLATAFLTLYQSLNIYYWMRRHWLKKYYNALGNKQREYLLLSISRFCQINRPLKGYYFEFGCHSGRTMALAWKHSRFLHDWKFVAFDSFEGLPEIPTIDNQEIWSQGKLCTSEEQFMQKMNKVGMPKHRLKTIKGFYDKTLTSALEDSLLPTKAVVIYIDCDLYTSTVPVLKFIRSFLQPGTILVFDDWNCFLGDPDRGERKAWKEFLQENTDLIFEPFISTNEAQSFIFIGKSNNA